MTAGQWEDDAAGSAVPDADDTEVFDAVVVDSGFDAGDTSHDWFSPAPDDARDLTSNVRRIRDAKSERPQPTDRDAKTGIPSVGEWQGFFGNVLIRLATDYYIDLAFRDIDESLLTEREIDRIKLDKTERDRVARPFAEYSYKSKFMRKHGRMIIASGDSIDAVIQLGMWFSRVRRIASKVRERQGMPRTVRASPVFRMQPRPQPPEQPQMQPQQPPFQHAPQQGESESVRFGSSEKPPSTIKPDGWRPDIAGAVFNPGG